MDNAKKFDPQADFMAAVRVYSEGRLDTALSMMNSLLAKHPQGAPRWFAVLASIHLKQDNRSLAADAFVREARINPEMAGEFIKHAVSLYHAVAESKKLCEIAEWAIAITPGDNKVASTVISALVENQRLDEAERYLHLLDMSNSWQVSILYVYYYTRRDPEKCFEVLDKGVSFSPDDGFLLSTRYAEARHILRFDIMREYAQLMQNPHEGRAGILFNVELALNRLYWSVSEALTSMPCRETTEVTTATARHKILPRRTISAAGEKIHIGYLSNDFYDHAVMSVLHGVLARHDRSRFDISLLSYTDPETARAQEKWPEQVRNAIVPMHGLSTPEAAKVISDRGIDILVDLKGYTRGARMDIVNISDAPIKVAYLGFPSTVVGCDLDYAITDHHITPDQSKLYWHEKLCRLPGSLMPNRPLEELKPQPTTRAEVGLPEGKFVFCSFNATVKISLRTMDMWCRILTALPEAILWIRCDVEITRGHLMEEFSANGVDPAQILFAPGTASFADHITRLSMGDLALDPTPYNGHVTTTDMLRAGLPVLAVRGGTSSSRMTEGQLTVLGLPELIAENEDDYVARAIAFAKDRNSLAAVRAKLLENRETSSLFDTPLYTQHLERAFEMMAERARAGLSPEHMDVPAIH